MNILDCKNEKEVREFIRSLPDNDARLEQLLIQLNELKKITTKIEENRGTSIWEFIGYTISIVVGLKIIMIIS